MHGHDSDWADDSGEDDAFDADGPVGWNDDAPDESTIPCPSCGREIYDDSPRCPHCGQYLSDEDAPPGRKPWWIVLGALLCLIAVGIWILAGL